MWGALIDPLAPRATITRIHTCMVNWSQLNVPEGEGSSFAYMGPMFINTHMWTKGRLTWENYAYPMSPRHWILDIPLAMPC